MASTEPSKRPLNEDRADNNHPAKRSKIAEPREVVDELEQQRGELAAPAVDEHIEAGTLLPALQQLLSVYQVEYWALLEEMRARHQTYCSSGRKQVHSIGAAVSLVTNSNKAVSDAASGSLQQLVQAALPQQLQPLATTDGPAHDQLQEAAYGDDRCGYGSCRSQPDLPSPTAVEQLLLQMPPGADLGSATHQQLQQWHERFKSASSAIAGLEQLASAASLQLMDAQGALACLCGPAGRWMIRRTAVSIGRSSDTKGDVDVDLSKAAAAASSAGATASTPAAAAGGGRDGGTLSAAAGVSVGIKKVSRLQAQLSLELDGSWILHNTGRAALVVNGSKVPQCSKVALPHLSLLEVGGEPLLFMINGLATQRAVARTSQLVM